MELLQQLDADLKTALLSKDQEAVSVLRMLKSELKNAEIATGKPLDEPAIQSVMRKEIKKRNESAGLYRQGGNSTQADQEEREAALLARYLPAPPSEEALSTFIKEKVAALGQPATPALKGQLIRETMANFNGTADGKLVASLVDKFLAQA